MTDQDPNSEFRERGGPAAIRGYRLQVLYALGLLLDSETRLRLEGHEDVDVLDSHDNPIDVIQVKAHGAALSMSTLRSESGATSFWERLRDLSVGHSSIRGTVVSFGEVGPELLGALKDNDKTHRDSVVRKLRSDYGVKKPKELLSRVGLHEEDEGRLIERLMQRLESLCPAASGATSLRLLSSWLLLRAELRAIVATRDVQEQLKHAGRFAADCRAYADEWFHTIVPLEATVSLSPKVLAGEFYEGIAARYEHIVANVDVERSRMMGLIDAAFVGARVVVVHGASGEGKSALLFRYAQSRAEKRYRFLVDVDSDLSRSLSIATALAAFARNSKDEVLLLLDTRPGNRHWTTVVEALASLENVRVLVGVREEDWREAHTVSYRARLADVAVRLEVDEAQEVFNHLQATRPGVAFVSFEDAWAKFGGSGPMLEFVHLITRHESLRERLQQQVRLLLRELTEEEADFCRLAACGTGYGGRVLARELMSVAQVGPSKAMSLMTRLEEEYFVRRANNGECVEPVHPIRSRILCEFLFDDSFYPLSSGLKKAAQIVHGDDLERLLFESFLVCAPEHLVADEVVSNSSANALSWRTCAGIARALLWLDLSAYVSETRGFVALAKLVLPGAWRFLLPWNFQPGWSGETTEALAQVRRALMKQHPERQEAATVLANGVPELKYRRLQPFLNRDWTTVTEPSSLSDWLSISELAYWHRTLAVQQAGPLSSVDAHAEIPEALPLQLQAELVSFGERLGGAQWSTVFRRVVQRYRIVWLDDSRASMRAVFLVGVREAQALMARGLKALNARAMDVSSCLRALIPGRGGYGCVGLAWPHQFVDHNPVEKAGIKPYMLEAKWNKRVLPVIMQMIERSTFPETWQDHAAQVQRFRQGFLESIRAVLIKFATEPTWNGRLPTERAEVHADWTEGAPLIPNCARDPWGVGTFGWEEDEDDQITWFPERFRVYQETIQSFHTVASTLVNELFTSGEDERDWANALRLGLSCWQALPKLHAVDRAPFRTWWPDAELDRHEAAERALLAELLAVINARSKGGATQPGVALHDMHQRVCSLLAEICAEIIGAGSAATADYVPFDQRRSPAVVLSPLDTSSIAAVDRELAIAKEACWRVLRRHSEDLRFELQVLAERITVLVTVNRVVVSVFPLSSLSAIMDDEEAFTRTMSLDVEDGECVARGLRSGRTIGYAESIATLTQCSLAAEDMHNNWTPAWNQPLAEQCLGEILEDLRAAVRTLLEVAQSTASTRASSVTAAARLAPLCAQFLDDDAESPALADLVLASMSLAAELRLDDALNR